MRFPGTRGLSVLGLAALLIGGLALPGCGGKDEKPADTSPVAPVAPAPGNTVATGTRQPITPKAGAGELSSEQQKALQIESQNSGGAH